MALMESLGLRDLIDKRCKYDRGKRILSPGMVTKILLGPTFNIHNKYPLYLVNKAYSSAPLDLICGQKVENDDINDYSLARGLDSLFDADLTPLFTECAETASRKIGCKSNILHMDCTDISFYGIEHEPDKVNASIPKHNGHPKDNRPELLQYQLQIVTDSNRIIRYMKTYDGNVGDSVMDKQTIADLTRIFPEEERKGITLVGDCKLATAGNIMDMIDSGFGFVSKCAVNFIDKGFERTRQKSIRSKMHSCSVKGLWMSDNDFEINLTNKRKETLRFVAFRYDVVVRHRVEAIRTELAQKIKTIKEELDGRKFYSEKEALEFAEDLFKKDDRIRANVKTVHCKPPLGVNSRGWWKLELSFFISEKKIRQQAELDKTVVLVTNLARPSEDDVAEDSCERVIGNLPRNSDTGHVDVPGRRDCVSDEGILGIYNSEYKVERSFALMKSGLGMNTVYVQKPSRENAMMFVISIGVLLSNIADEMFRRADTRIDGHLMTMHRLSHELQTTLVTYSRSENSLRLLGPPEVTRRFFEYTDTLGINPQLLLGYLDN